MKNEQRPVVIQTSHYACLQKLLFDEAVASLIEMCNNIPIEELKMAAAIYQQTPYRAYVIEIVDPHHLRGV